MCWVLGTLYSSSNWIVAIPFFVQNSASSERVCVCVCKVEEVLVLGSFARPVEVDVCLFIYIY